MDWTSFMTLVVQPLVSAFAGQYGIIVQIVAVIGTLRVMLVPIMSALQFYFGYLDTNPADDAAFTSFQNSKAYAVIVFLLDYLGSIKLPPPANQNTNNTTPPTTGG